ncbi:MAG: exodeoxyribonuclease VII small subunit [Ruminococcaceae bacterium]|nr:exodeoxyribonuclease VII small subunit [Oscillospiraceae bacterium]
MSEEKMSFEQAMVRLEEIVRSLERGDAPLDQSLALFEEGTSLVRLCTTALEQAQQRVTILLKQDDGRVTEQIFDGGSADGSSESV